MAGLPASGGLVRISAQLASCADAIPENASSEHAARALAISVFPLRRTIIGFLLWDQLSLGKGDVRHVRCRCRMPAEISSHRRRRLRSRSLVVMVPLHPDGARHVAILSPPSRWYAVRC